MSTLKPFPLWIAVWLAVSTIIVFWDAGYLINRPHSFQGGRYNWLWQPYNLYATIDHVYSPQAYKAQLGFPLAQSLLNVCENIFNITALSKRTSRPLYASLLALFSITCTFWKTVLYFTMDACEGPHGWGNTAHNDFSTWLTLYVIPNGVWIVMPALCVLSLISHINSLSKPKTKRE
ncbi:hypothetical protein HDV03_003487 [Kappamyces sp. JEL0829]|nr:hypothetical protein HDV03_003487 [Kappamyces sp. JEL0829]KAJ3329823.1 hypothetical protein HDU91_003749 [Kappamyces sp. JEL0680]